MQLTVLGASPSMENPGGASSGYLIEEGETRLLLECGHGVVGVLGQIMEPTKLTAIIVSHMHPDHFFDLVPLTYAFKFLGGHASPPLFLPPDGLDVLRPLQSAVDLSETFFSDTFDVQTYNPAQRLRIGDLTIDFAPTRHFIPGYAMRFSNNAGRTLAYSSDTGWTETVLDLMRGTSAALVEATVVRYQSEHEAEGHLSAGLAGQMAKEAGTERLIVTHSWRPAAEETLREAAESFGGPVALATERERFAV